jgi:integration host factor subunit beta
MTKLTQAPAAMTKRAIISELVVRRASLGLRDSTALVNAIFDAMSDVLVRGDRIEIRGFGSFGVKQRTARQGRNPKTGARVRVEAKRVPFFRAGKELRLEVNGDTAIAAPHPG